MPTIVERAEAREDRIEVELYLILNAPEAVDTVMREIDARYHFLAERPLAGRVRPDLDESAKLRSFPVGRYVVFYELLDDGIEVVRLLHSSRDLRGEFE